VGEKMKAYEPLISSDDERQLYDHFKASWTKYQEESKRALDADAAGRRTEYDRQITDAVPEFDAASATLDSIVALNSAGGLAANHEGDALYASTRLTLIIALLVVIGFGFFQAILISARIAGPVQQMVGAAESLANGDLTVQVDATSRDEVGRLGTAFNAMSHQLSGSMASIARNAGELASTAEQLTRVSQTMSAGAEETSVQANVVARATDGVNRNVQTVATASEEMSASIQEISKNAGQAARVAADAVMATDTANQTISRLGTSSNEIGAVVKTITSIAEQTNLLALNATIEAARAGEAGKGFAVVANEVKELAKETARATEDISRKVQAIQADTESAVQAIREIGEVVNQISAAQTTIASAVEEQTATTNEINRTLTEAAAGAAEIVQNVSGVATAASETTRGATDTQTAAAELARMASTLSELVGQFRYDESAARKPRAGARPGGRKPSAPSAPGEGGLELSDFGEAFAARRRGGVLQGTGNGQH
jgi:methyl-accepting chemotaxis protein